MGRENEQGKGVRDEGICRRDEKWGMGRGEGVRERGKGGGMRGKRLVMRDEVLGKREEAKSKRKWVRE